jgi:hypothetical protein
MIRLRQVSLASVLDGAGPVREIDVQDAYQLSPSCSTISRRTMNRFAMLVRSAVAAVGFGLVSFCVLVALSSTAMATEYKITIVQPPQDATVCEGQTVTLTVQATTDYPNGQFGYQWLFQNQPLSDGGKYSGTTTNSLTITNISAAEAGDYTVIVSVTNGTGVNPQTALARITVIPAPTITQQPQAVTVCSGQQASMSVAVSGGLNVRYQWYVNGTAVPGETRSSISATADQAMDGARVYCRISSDCGDVSSDTATVTVLVAPTITQQPTASDTAAIGRSYQLTVQASGSPTLQYQWYKNDQPIPGATSNTYTITNVSANDAGTYKVRITNSCGTVESNTSVIAVASVEDDAIAAGYRLRIDPQPASDNVTLVVTTPNAASVTVELVDMSGRSLGTLWSGISSGSEQKLDASIGNVAAGVYRCVLRSGSYRLSTPLVIVR